MLNCLAGSIFLLTLPKIFQKLYAPAISYFLFQKIENQKNRQAIEITGDKMADRAFNIFSKLAFCLLRPFCPNTVIQFYYV